jgi:hypothetical protein
MHLSGCILIVGLAILGAVSVRITYKGSKQDVCLEGDGNVNHNLKVAKCDPNSTFQNWLVDGDHIKNEKLQQKCLVDDELISGVKLALCEFTQSHDKKINEKATNARKIRIEGNEVKNYKNQCLHFERSRASFDPCEGDSTFTRKAYVV